MIYLKHIYIHLYTLLGFIVKYLIGCPVGDFGFEIQIFLKPMQGDRQGGIFRTDCSITMSQWSGEHRAFAVKAYFKANNSCINARRQFCTRFDIRRLSDAPSENLIRTWVQKFRATGKRPTARPQPKIKNR